MSSLSGVLSSFDTACELLGLGEMRFDEDDELELRRLSLDSFVNNV